MDVVIIGESEMYSGELRDRKREKDEENFNLLFLILIFFS